MRRIILPLLVLALLLGMAQPALAQRQVCEGATCTEEKVGAFLEGIQSQCYNAGQCSIADIVIVFENTGNFVISIIGAIVLLMYVIGGIFMLSSGGNQERISRGKNMLKISTIGLLIVLVAGAGIRTLDTVLKTGGTACGDKAVGESCGVNAVCEQVGNDRALTCQTLCTLRQIDEVERAAGINAVDAIFGSGSLSDSSGLQIQDEGGEDIITADLTEQPKEIRCHDPESLDETVQSVLGITNCQENQCSNPAFLCCEQE